MSLKKKTVRVRAYDKIKSMGKVPSMRVYICSPLKGNITTNQNKARTYCRFAFDKGYVPVCPHIYFPQFLNEENKDERAAGIYYGLELMWQVSELWVFGERISEGMRAEIELAEDLKKPIIYFNEEMEVRA